MRGRRALPAWLSDNALLLEAFIAINLAFLALDIYVAHSMNAFRHSAEWIPFYFSIAGALVVAAGVGRAFLMSLRPRTTSGDTGTHTGTHAAPLAATQVVARTASPATTHASAGLATGAGRWVGLVIGWGSIAVGVAGLLWHLQSHFFRAATLKNLVYSAPFIAPLAYTGIGFLLLANRLLPHRSQEWTRWILFLAWAGFLGNFGLSLLDHAQNGFFYSTEWISVAVSALAVGYLLVLILAKPTRTFLVVGWAVLALQGATGALGFLLHLRPLATSSPTPLFERIIHGPPVFAPLLFVNLALLAAIGMLELRAKVDRADDVVSYSYRRVGSG